MSSSSTLSGMIIDPTHPQFFHLALNYNLSYHHIPSLIIYPEQIEDIKAAISYAISNKLCVKCRSGGYSPVSFSNGNKALIIDFKNFKSFEFNREQETVTIGAGLLHGELNEKLSKIGYHFPGLQYQNVSVVGFISGGGIGLSSRTYGLGCDQLIEVKLMDTEGNIRVCNNQTHRDLFWAIRGGGGNRFGIIISLTLKVFPIKCVTIVEIHYDKIARFHVLHRLQNEYHTMTTQVSVQLKISHAGCCIKVLSYLPINVTKTHLQNLLNISGKKSVQTHTNMYHEAVKIVDTISTSPHFFKLTSRFIYQKLDDTRIHTLLDTIDNGKNVVLIFNLLGGKVSLNKHYNSSFNHREAIFLQQTYVTWERYEYISHYLEYIEKVNAIFLPEITSMYINIAESHGEKVNQDYYPTHLHALSAVKLKYAIEGGILS